MKIPVRNVLNPEELGLGFFRTYSESYGTNSLVPPRVLSARASEKARWITFPAFSVRCDPHLDWYKVFAYFSSGFFCHPSFVRFQT